MAILSILGLYNWDPDVFDLLVLPTADDITDDAEKVADPWVPVKDELVQLICMRYAELSLVYPDWNDMRTMIGIWSKARLHTWIALYNTMLYAYNPIWNKDGYSKETRNLTGSNNRTANLANTDTTDTINYVTKQTGSVIHQVTGFDTNSFSDNTKDIPDLSDTTNGRVYRSGTETGTDNHATTDKGTIIHEENGNIGVTTTQQMIKEQRDIVAFNLYETIAEEFKNEFCIQLY